MPGIAFYAWDRLLCLGSPFLCVSRVHADGQVSPTEALSSVQALVRALQTLQALQPGEAPEPEGPRSLLWQLPNTARARFQVHACQTLASLSGVSVRTPP